MAVTLSEFILSQNYKLLNSVSNKTYVMNDIIDIFQYLEL